MMRGIKHILMPLVRRMRGCTSRWPISRLERCNMDLYERKHGYRFDINAPVTFTEKIQWYKLRYDNGSLVNIVDKAMFKDYVKERLGDGYTIRMFNVYDDLDSIRRDWDNLPEEFVLKSTVQSDGKFIKVIRNRSSIRFEDIRGELKEWFDPYNTLINSFCRAYYKAKPRVLAEEYMSQIDGQLYDYKIFCFNGVPYCVYVAVDHFLEDDYPITFYDMDWNMMDVKYGRHSNAEVPIPKHWDEMKDIACRLSEGFPFVRVDFFDTDEKLLMAEMTLYPGGGMVPYHPDSFNRELGDKFELPL